MARNAQLPSSVTLFLRLRLDAAVRTQVLDSLRAMGARTEVKPGCRCVEIYVSADDVDVIVLIEEWESTAMLESHIRSTDFRAVLAAIDLSNEQPEIQVDQVLIRQGLNYLQTVLSSHE